MPRRMTLKVGNFHFQPYSGGGAGHGASTSSETTSECLIPVIAAARSRARARGKAPNRAPFPQNQNPPSGARMLLTVQFMVK